MGNYPLIAFCAELESLWCHLQFCPGINLSIMIKQTPGLKLLFHIHQKTRPTQLTYRSILTPCMCPWVCLLQYLGHALCEILCNDLFCEHISVIFQPGARHVEEETGSYFFTHCYSVYCLHTAVTTIKFRRAIPESCRC